MHLLTNKNIAIVGGGPGGLTLARLLQMKGIHVKVYERDVNKDARVQGAIVDLHFDSGLKAIEAAGLTEAFKANYMQGAERIRSANQDLSIIDDEVNDANVSFGHPHFRPEIDRGVLRNVLLDSLLPDTVIWDCQFVGMQQVNGSWQIRFKNGTVALADIVIGADGYRSKIRPYVSNSQELYSGVAFIQGEVEFPEKDCPEMFRLVDNANFMARGTGKTIAIQPSGNGSRLTFYTASLYPENWMEVCGINFNNSDEAAAYLVSFFHDWNPMFFTLFNACKQFVPRPLNYFPLDQQWETKSNVTLIGDAAHLMPPSGEGVNTAMLDTLDLCESLTNSVFETIEGALAAYEKQMWERAQILLEESLAGIKKFVSPTEESIKPLQ